MVALIKNTVKLFPEYNAEKGKWYEVKIGHYCPIDNVAHYHLIGTNLALPAYQLIFREKMPASILEEILEDVQNEKN